MRHIPPLLRRYASNVAQIMTMSIFSLVIISLQSSTTHAQWTGNGNNINNTNTGNVGVGTTTAPTHKLTVGSGTTTSVNPTFTILATSPTTDTGIAAVADTQDAVYLYADTAENVFGLNAFDYGSSVYRDVTVGWGGKNVLLARDGGNVGIGTITPAYKLDVQGGAINSSGGLCIAGDCKTAWSQVGGGGGSSQWTTSGSNVYYNTGNVGIGTTTPGRPLVVTADASGVPLRVYRNANHIGWGTGIQWAFNNSSGNVADYAYVNSSIVDNTAGAENGTLGFFTAKAGTLTQQAIIDQNGNVGIGTVSPTSKLHVAGDGRVTGNLTVDGNIAAKYQDVAEWVPTTHELPAGTVVTLDPTRSNHVEASSKAYDTRVAGVISAQPGIALGERGENKVLVATTGRVRVKVDATRAPIRIGDLLVTGDTPGVAMKSEPITIGGRQMHSPGTLIGKALEPLEKGRGEILVLLSLQ